MEMSSLRGINFYRNTKNRAPEIDEPETIHRFFSGSELALDHLFRSGSVFFPKIRVRQNRKARGSRGKDTCRALRKQRDWGACQGVRTVGFAPYLQRLSGTLRLRQDTPEGQRFGERASRRVRGSLETRTEYYTIIL